MASELTGAEKLRAIVAWIDYHDERFLDRFTSEQLIMLWDYGHRHADRVPEMADTWDEADIENALARVSP